MLYNSTKESGQVSDRKDKKGYKPKAGRQVDTFFLEGWSYPIYTTTKQDRLEVSLTSVFI